VSISATRFRSTVAAGATAVVIGSGFALVGLHQRAVNHPPLRSADAAPLAASSGANRPAAALAATPPHTTAPPTTAPATAKPHATGKPTPRGTPRPTTRPPSGAGAPSTGSAILTAVLAHINAARSTAGLPAYAFSSALSKASALHNQKMIGGCGLAHQCPGEAGIGTRFSAQGVAWTAAGENIGFGSAGAGDAAIIRAANGLTDSMLAEKPPDDGHRKNLLSGSFKRIGLSVVRDGDGKVWMTQDFVN